MFGKIIIVIGVSLNILVLAQDATVASSSSNETVSVTATTESLTTTTQAPTNSTTISTTETSNNSTESSTTTTVTPVTTEKVSKLEEDVVANATRSNETNVSLDSETTETTNNATTTTTLVKDEEYSKENNVTTKNTNLTELNVSAEDANANPKVLTGQTRRSNDNGNETSNEATNETFVDATKGVSNEDNVDKVKEDENLDKVANQTRQDNFDGNNETSVEQANYGTTASYPDQLKNNSTESLISGRRSLEPPERRDSPVKSEQSHETNAEDNKNLSNEATHDVASDKTKEINESIEEESGNENHSTTGQPLGTSTQNTRYRKYQLRIKKTRSDENRRQNGTRQRLNNFGPKQDTAKVTENPNLKEQLEKNVNDLKKINEKQEEDETTEASIENSDADKDLDDTTEKSVSNEDNSNDEFKEPVDKTVELPVLSEEETKAIVKPDLNEQKGTTFENILLKPDSRRRYNLQSEPVPKFKTTKEDVLERFDNLESEAVNKEILDAYRGYLDGLKRKNNLPVKHYDVNYEKPNENHGFRPQKPAEVKNDRVFEDIVQPGYLRTNDEDRFANLNEKDEVLNDKDKIRHFSTNHEDRFAKEEEARTRCVDNNCSRRQYGVYHPYIRPALPGQRQLNYGTFQRYRPLHQALIRRPTIQQQYGPTFTNTDRLNNLYGHPPNRAVLGKYENTPKTQDTENESMLSNIYNMPSYLWDRLVKATDGVVRNIF